jgi:hypothetical protein
MIVFGVYLCGPTDCFLHAVFIDKAKAVEWAKTWSRNPEGYIVQELNTFYSNIWGEDE